MIFRLVRTSCIAALVCACASEDAGHDPTTASSSTPTTSVPTTPVVPAAASPSSGPTSSPPPPGVPTVPTTPSSPATSAPGPTSTPTAPTPVEPTAPAQGGGPSGPASGGSGGSPPAAVGGGSSGGATDGGANDPGGGGGEAGAGTGGQAAAGAAGAPTAGGAGAPSEALYNPCPPEGEPCRIVPFGDSITDGFNIPGGYRVELFHLALEAGQNIEFFGSGSNGPTMVDGVPFPQHHEGHSGYTIDDAPQAGRSGISPLVDTVLGFEPDIILLKIGTNDLDNDVDVGNAPARLGNLLDNIFGKNDHVLVVVAQIVPSRDAQLNALVATYNAAIPDLVAERQAQGKHALVADVHAAFMAHPDYQTSLLADTLHPNEAGYALLGQSWYEVIGDLLR